MNSTRLCGCKSYRTCLLCEKSLGIQKQTTVLNKEDSFVYCFLCNKIYPGWNLNIYKNHPNHNASGLEFRGIYIQEEFLSNQEEERLMRDIDNTIWTTSQSGRRKQNYGPKCNFKKRKLKLGDFCGFPKHSEFVQHKFKNVPLLRNFQTIEQCSLEYDPERGASIDPHIDDCWIWGERIVTVNMLADSVLTLTYNKCKDRYNLDCVADYPVVINKENEANETQEVFQIQDYEADRSYSIVRIPMPRRSLLIMFGEPRYNWEHQILREDITQRRVCLAYREFTPPYLENGELHHEGKDVLEMAQNFF